MKKYITNDLVSTVILLLIAVAIWPNHPVVWGITLAAMFVYSWVSSVKISMKLKEQAAQQKAELNDAGNAIADAIKVILENIKKLQVKQTKIEHDLREQTARLHKLSNDQRRKEINRLNPPKKLSNIDRLKQPPEPDHGEEDTEN